MTTVGKLFQSLRLLSGLLPPPSSLPSPGLGPTLCSLCNVAKGLYIYMEDLQKLHSCSYSFPRSLLGQHLERIPSPLEVASWENLLASHPDKRFQRFIVEGIQRGFRIGCNPSHPRRSSSRNMRSAYDHPQVVQEYLDREVALNRVVKIRAKDAEAIEGLQLNPIGVIPKRGRPGKWRLIVDLSSPEGGSVNDGITSELCSISYASVDDAVRMILQLGKGTLLAKLDIKEAYRIVPVYPGDRHLLGISWQGSVFIDGALPFGLRSAPKIFSALADGLLWIMLHSGVHRAIHYLDDFLFFGQPSSDQCRQSLQAALVVCQQLGVPLAPEKTEGPSTVLTFLGIEFDTCAGQLRLPQDKLVRLQSSVSQWMQSHDRSLPKRSGKKRDLLSLIGLLHHATKVVRPGRAFLRSLINAASSVSALDHYVHLTPAAKADLCWWNRFLPFWNGVSVLTPSKPSFSMASDASGSWGCGAVSGDKWFQLSWPSSWQDVPISPKELVPIIVAVALWGPLWAGSKVTCQCDNMAVVYSVNKGTAKDPRLVRLLHILAFWCAMFNIFLVAQHLPGIANTSADALSRNNYSLFSSLCPQAAPVPSGVPACLQDLVLDQSLRWTSPRWMQLFKATLETVSLLLRKSPTPQHLNVI